MSLRLTKYQKQIADVIQAMTREAKQRSAASEQPRVLIYSAAHYAHALHSDIEQSGQRIQHSKIMLGNRRVSPESLEFYQHLHSLEDFVGMLVTADVEGENDLPTAN